jgi:hypothetical protein
MKNSIKEIDIYNGIKSGYKIGLNCYTPMTTFMKNLEIIIRMILDHYAKQDMLPTIFGVVHELVRFSVISNMRCLYYESQNLKIENEESFYSNEPEFLKTISNHDIKYRESLVANKMYVQTIIEHSKEGLVITVYNHAENYIDHEFYLRNYLKAAMNYNNIMDYFQDHPEDPQGRNLGLALSIILLRESGLRPDLMRMSKPGSRNFSRIEIPFDINTYQSIRDKILRGEEIVPFEKTNLIPPQYKEQFEQRKKELELQIESN